MYIFSDFHSFKRIKRYEIEKSTAFLYICSIKYLINIR